MLARERLKTAAAAPPARRRRKSRNSWPESACAASAPVATEAAAATQTRIERSRLLRAAGLNDLADAELRFGMRTDGQPALLAMELADSADAPHQAMRIMKSNSPEYLNLPVPGRAAQVLGTAVPAALPQPTWCATPRTATWIPTCSRA